MRRGMETISLWHCSGVMKAQIALITAFRSSACWVWCLSIFLLTIPHTFSMGFRSGEFAGPIKHSNTMVIEPAFGTFGSVGRCQVLLENEISISHKACQQKEAWSALKLPCRWLRWLWTSENTMDQHRQMTWQPKSWLETSYWTSSNMDSVPLSSSDGYFQQDNAPCNKAQIISDWFLENNNEFTLLKWPPQSPDLNPIEHLWDVVEWEILIMDVQPTNLQQLHDAIMSIWTKISEDCFQHLVESMPRRIKEVLKSKGGPTGRVLARHPY